MSSPAQIIHQLLIDLGLVDQSGDWPAYVSFMPEEQPDQAVCVYDTAGTSDGRIMRSGERIEHPGVQIRVRGINYPVVWHKANEIALALDAQNNVQVETESDLVFNVQNISRTGPIVPLGVEVNGPRRRHNFTINAITTYAAEVVWILATGLWNDAGFWSDHAFWID